MKPLGSLDTGGKGRPGSCQRTFRPRSGNPHRKSLLNLKHKIKREKDADTFMKTGLRRVTSGVKCAREGSN